MVARMARRLQITSVAKSLAKNPRATVEEVRDWCEGLGLELARCTVEGAYVVGVVKGYDPPPKGPYCHAERGMLVRFALVERAPCFWCER